MLNSWLRRSSLKKTHKGKRLVIMAGSPSMVNLLTLSAVFVVVGVFVVQMSWAAGLSERIPVVTPVPHETLSPVPTPSPTPSLRP